MPRGDEYEADEPRRGKAAPRYDDRDEDDDLDDLDDRRRRLRRPQRSGLVLTVGIVGIVLASLYLICGAFASISGLCLTGGMPLLQQMMAQQAKQDPNAAQAAQQLAQVQGQVPHPRHHRAGRGGL